MYFDEFERVNQERLEQGLPTLKVGITFSMSTNNSDNQLTTNDGLLRAMKHYNKMFGTSFGLDDVSGYTQDLTTRLNRTAQDGQYLDIVIVVDQLLTGFDAPQLNTLYVDRTLKDAMLIQAYSRTNRIADNQGKPWGRIVNYRWPAKNEELMNRALSIYANKHSADVQETLVDTKVLVDSGVLAKPFKEQFEEVKQVVDRLADMTDNFTEVPASEAKQEEMFNLMRTYSAGMSKLKQYDPDVVNGEDIGFDYDNPDELVTLLGMTPEQEEMLTTSLYNDLKERIAENHDVPVAQVELRMIHVKQISVNYDYLTELIEALMNAVHEKRMDAAADYREKINDFAMALDDRQYAKQINNAADAIYKGTYPPEGKTIQYPVKLTSLEVIEDVNTMIMKDDIFDFRLKWGIIDVISNDEILDLFSRHTAGKQDLDSTGRISKLKKDARAEYQAKAQDTDIVSLNKIKYGNELVAALYKFADSYVNER
jgi:type I site-specific deoxyribonuclease, hsdR family